MRNGRFHPSKYRGKVPKMGVLYAHPPKMLGSSSNFLKIQFFIKKSEKIEGKLGNRRQQPVVC
jgi:hypothetical protein